VSTLTQNLHNLSRAVLGESHIHQDRILQVGMATTDSGIGEFSTGETSQPSPIITKVE
jgi:hypothetical protein